MLKRCIRFFHISARKDLSGYFFWRTIKEFLRVRESLFIFRGPKNVVHVPFAWKDTNCAKKPDTFEVSISAGYEKFKPQCAHSKRVEKQCWLYKMADMGYNKFKEILEVVFKKIGK